MHSPYAEGAGVFNPLKDEEFHDAFRPGTKLGAPLSPTRGLLRTG